MPSKCSQRIRRYWLTTAIGSGYAPIPSRFPTPTFAIRQAESFTSAAATNRTPFAQMLGLGTPPVSHIRMHAWVASTWTYTFPKTRISSSTAASFLSLTLMSLGATTETAGPSSAHTLSPILADILSTIPYVSPAATVLPPLPPTPTLKTTPCGPIMSSASATASMSSTTSSL